MPIANTCSIGYPHDGRADNAAYRHDRRADNAAYRHDRRADSLSVKHRWLKYSNVYINHDHVMTLTKFMARSTWVAYAFEIVKMSFEGKSQQEIGKWTEY